MDLIGRVISDGLMTNSGCVVVDLLLCCMSFESNTSSGAYRRSTLNVFFTALRLHRGFMHLRMRASMLLSPQNGPP